MFQYSLYSTHKYQFKRDFMATRKKFNKTLPDDTKDLMIHHHCPSQLPVK